MAISCRRLQRSSSIYCCCCCIDIRLLLKQPLDDGKVAASYRALQCGSSSFILCCCRIINIRLLFKQPLDDGEMAPSCRACSAVLPLTYPAVALTSAFSLSSRSTTARWSALLPPLAVQFFHLLLLLLH
jgi:hypothetical protein